MMKMGRTMTGYDAEGMGSMMDRVEETLRILDLVAGRSCIDGVAILLEVILSMGI